MYQARVHHTLSPVVPNLADEDRQTLWGMFVAIGEHWRLVDDPEPYRRRHDAFLENRINLFPLYQGYYRKGADLLRQLIEQHGESEAYNRLLSAPSGQSSSAPVDEDTLDILRKRIVEEFIAIRLALGGFFAFGAINYRGYFGGALLPGAKPPYRT